MSVVVVTGSSGFIGRQVAAALANAETPALSIQHRWDNRSQLEALLGDEPVERCIHLGWYAHPRDYLLAAGPNTKSLFDSVSLVEALLDRGCRHLTVAGTSAEYGRPDSTVSEAAPIHPLTVYAAAKTALRLLLQSTWVKGEMLVAWARLFNVIGPGEHPERVIPEVTRALLSKRRVAVSDGGQIRDFLGVRDVAMALSMLSKAEAEGIFNVSSGQPTSLRDTFLQLADITAADPELVDFGARPRTPNDPPFLVGDSGRLRSAIGWAPSQSINEVLAEVVAFWKSATST